MQKSNTREELQEVLQSPSFSINGATGKIQFDKSGDRVDNPMFLVQVQKEPGTDKYKFEPINP
ncbi:hypothetical protein [Nostoc sp. CCY0012]|uniref:hypothetical protein n=1 Tax=Nostoc sp. CCY0012 TaxID=1056123 RepID=UPI0039C72EB3